MMTVLDYADCFLVLLTAKYLAAQFREVDFSVVRMEFRVPPPLVEVLVARCKAARAPDEVVYHWDREALAVRAWRTNQTQQLVGDSEKHVEENAEYAEHVETAGDAHVLRSAEPYLAARVHRSRGRADSTAAAFVAWCPGWPCMPAQTGLGRSAQAASADSPRRSTESSPSAGVTI